MLKNTLASTIGIISAFIIFLIFEYVGSLLHPIPNDLNIDDTVAMKEYAASIPAFVLIIVLLGYAIGSLVCGMIIGKISTSPRKITCIIAGIVLTIGAIFNLMEISHPIWFIVINLLIYLPMILVGYSITKSSLN